MLGKTYQGFGLVLGDFTEGLKKWGFAPYLMVSGKGDNAMIGYLSKLSRTREDQMQLVKK